MTTTSEQKEVRDFILASDDNVRTAKAVAEVWLETRNDVVRRFLKALRERIADELRGIEDLRLDSDFANKGRDGGIWVFRTAWSTGGGPTPIVRLSPDSGVSNWYVGVSIDSDSNDTDVGERLQQRLHHGMPPGGRRSAGWPWFRYLEEHRDWAPLVARLHEETGNARELTDDLSGCLVEVAKAAVPVIDAVVATDR